jgi:hypothetical protein
MDPTTPGLHWSIKHSFVLYVARMADGDILGGPGAGMTDARTFVWEADTALSSVHDSQTSLACTGEVVFSAHDGALSFRIAQPRMELASDLSLLTIAGEADGRIPFVDFTAVRESDADGRVWRGTRVRLREEALALFAGYYGAGEEFDDLRIVLPPPT